MPGRKLEKVGVLLGPQEGQLAPVGINYVVRAAHGAIGEHAGIGAILGIHIYLRPLVHVGYRWKAVGVHYWGLERSILYGNRCRPGRCGGPWTHNYQHA